MSGILFYLLWGILWGMFSARMQTVVYPETDLSHIIQAFVFNAFLPPVGMVVAIITAPSMAKRIKEL